jgi:hypothetical protein
MFLSGCEHNRAIGWPELAIPTRELTTNCSSFVTCPAAKVPIEGNLRSITVAYRNIGQNNTRRKGYRLHCASNVASSPGVQGLDPADDRTISQLVNG